MTNYDITVVRDDASVETHSLVNATYEPDMQIDADDEGLADWTLEDGHIFTDINTIDLTEVEDVGGTD